MRELRAVVWREIAQRLDVSEWFQGCPVERGRRRLVEGRWPGDEEVALWLLVGPWGLLRPCPWEALFP
jgi:hypothetical protein